MLFLDNELNSFYNEKFNFGYTCLNRIYGGSAIVGEWKNQDLMRELSKGRSSQL